jgi:uncharacterized protein DUF4386
MDVMAHVSPRRLARIVGALSLVNIVAGGFALGIVPAMLVVPGDPAATTHNFQTHELLYRVGVAAHLLITVTNVPGAVIAYDLFKVVNRRIARLDLCLTLVATTLEAAAVLGQSSPHVLPDSGYSFYTEFYGVDDFCLAYLLVRSTFIPRAFGALIAIDGLAYLANSFANLLAPGFATHLAPWIQLPILPAEGSLCLWLLVAGVNVTRWREQARRLPAHRAASII